MERDDRGQDALSGVRLLGDDTLVRDLQNMIAEGISRLEHPTRGYVNHANHLEIEVAIGKSRYMVGNGARTKNVRVPVMTPTPKQLPAKFTETLSMPEHRLPLEWQPALGNSNMAKFRALSAPVFHGLIKACTESFWRTVECKGHTPQRVFHSSDEPMHIVGMTSWTMICDENVDQMLDSDAGGKLRVPRTRAEPEHIQVDARFGLPPLLSEQLDIDRLYANQMSDNLRNLSLYRLLLGSERTKSLQMAESISTTSMYDMTRVNSLYEEGTFDGAPIVAPTQADKTFPLFGVKFVPSSNISYRAGETPPSVHKVRIGKPLVLRSPVCSIFDMSISVMTEILVQPTSLTGFRLSPLTMIAYDVMGFFAPKPRSRGRRAKVTASTQPPSSAMAVDDPDSADNQPQQDPVQPDQASLDLLVEMAHNQMYVPVMTYDPLKTKSTPSVSVKCRQSFFFALPGIALDTATWRADLTCAFRSHTSSFADMANIAEAYRMHLMHWRKFGRVPISVADLESTKANKFEMPPGVTPEDAERYLPTYEIELELIDPVAYLNAHDRNHGAMAESIVRESFGIQRYLCDVMLAGGELHECQLKPNPKRTTDTVGPLSSIYV